MGPLAVWFRAVVQGMELERKFSFGPTGWDWTHRHRAPEFVAEFPIGASSNSYRIDPMKLQTLSAAALAVSLTLGAVPGLAGVGHSGGHGDQPDIGQVGSVDHIQNKCGRGCPFNPPE